MTKSSVSLVLLFVGLSTQFSRTVCRQSYHYRYTSPEQYVVSPTSCKTVDTMVKSKGAYIKYVGGGPEGFTNLIKNIS